jgi:membrane protease YdiL (CAAX protease family)
MSEISRGISIFLLCASGVLLIALQLRPVGWVALGLSALSLLFADKRFREDVFLIVIALVILGLTPINTDTGIEHILYMGVTLGAAVAIPYLISRFVYKDYRVRFPWRHDRHWYKSEIVYVVVAGVVSYFLLPFYLKSTGAYLNWPSELDTGSVIRLFIGTNGLGIWDELFFISTVLGILRHHFTFWAANFFQSVLFASFLYELGFTSWGFIMVFFFALLQGYIFMKTESLFYVVTIHLTVDLVLFLALIYAYHPTVLPIFFAA